jgi:putative ABC transport system permease protein
LKKKQHIPPKSAQQFLNWFLRDELAEEVQGDIEEQFNEALENSSIFRAKINYWFQVINYLRPFAISKSSPTFLLNYGMFRNYFKISIRNLYKQKLYAAINIGGLAVGLCCFILIFLFVQHELSYDRSYENADRIYRIIRKYQADETHLYPGYEYSASTTAILAPTLAQEFPEVTAATTVDNQAALLGLDQGDKFLEVGLLADPHFLEVFNYTFTHGSAKTALDNPNSIVLTESLSKKIFGNGDPIGQTLIYQNGTPNRFEEEIHIGESYMVTGVINDPPDNISFRFSFIASILSNSDYVNEIKGSLWVSANSWWTYLSLSKGVDPKLFQDKLPLALNKDKEEEEKEEKYAVQSLTEVYLQTNVNDYLSLHANQRYIYLFSGIAIIVLLLACANYMNLAIARSVNRAREVGLRKVVGARHQQLIFQFLGESVLITFLALLLALGLTLLVLPTFGSVVERSLELSFLENRILIPGLFILVLAVGLISGSYPALYMSSLRPFLVLKGKIENRTSGFNLQKFLIVMQYAVSIILVIGSIVIYRQLQFIQNKELGYDKEHVITLDSRDNSVNKSFDVIHNELLQNPQIIAVTKSGHLPTNIRGWFTFRKKENGNKEDEESLMYRSLVYYDFLEVFGIELIAGRDFSKEIKSDMGGACMINETAAKAFGWTPEEAIGKVYGNDFPVIGVIRDIHMHSMHEPIQPLMLILHNGRGRYISLKVRPERISETIALVEKTFKKYSPFPLEYSFLDDRFDELYKSEMKMGEIFGFFTVLSILIASLGIFGMAAFSTGQRTKEIGIRKVMGASVRSIMTLLSRDFLILVVVAFFIALPFAWYAIDQWLQDFAYKIDIEWWVFALAGLFVLLIAYLAIGYQSIKAAFINPVDSLRSE